MSNPSSKQSKRDTGMTFKSSASKKISRKKDTEERFTKLMNNKLHDVSYFKGEPP